MVGQHPIERLDEGLIGNTESLVAAAVQDKGSGLVGGDAEFGDQRRLAHPRFPGDQDDLPIPRQSGGSGLVEACPFGRTADEDGSAWSNKSPRQGLGPQSFRRGNCGVRRGPTERVSHDWFAHALQVEGTTIGEVVAPP